MPDDLHCVPISIVAATLDHERTLPLFLDGLEREGPCEVVVVDGGSLDWTREIAAARGIRVLSVPHGVGERQRAGARAARHPVVLFANPDDPLAPGTLARVRDAWAHGFDAGAFDAGPAPRSAHEWLGDRIHDLYVWMWGGTPPRSAWFVTRPALAAIGGLESRRALLDDLGVLTELDLFDELNLASRLETAGYRYSRLGPVAGWRRAPESRRSEAQWGSSPATPRVTAST